MKPHKIMTPEEYAAMPIIGWHRVCRDVDGMGNVGVQFEGKQPPERDNKVVTLPVIRVERY